MKMFFTRRGLKGFLCLSGICMAVVSIASAKGMQGGWGDFSWRISASAVNRTITGTTFKPGSKASESDAPSISTGIRGLRADVGPQDKYANREYDDGHVHMGLLTFESGITRDWGVDNPSQIRDGKVVMTASDGVETFSQGRQTDQTGGESSGGGSQSSWGSSFQLEAIYAQSETTSWCLLLGLSSVGMSEDNTVTSFSDEQQWKDVGRKIVDTFSTQGSGILRVNPSSREFTYANPREHTLRTYNVVDQNLSFDLNTVSLGVSREHTWKWFVFQVAGGPTVNFVSADSSRNESVLASQDGGPSTLIREWRDSSSEDDVLAGVFAQGGASLNMGKLVRMGIVGRYDVAQEYKGVVGPSTYTADLNGFSVAMSLGWDL